MVLRTHKNKIKYTICPQVLQELVPAVQAKVGVVQHPLARKLCREDRKKNVLLEVMRSMK